MNLYFMRHGIAVEPESEVLYNDKDRALTEKGRKRVSQIAKGIKVMDVCFDLILSSPYLRARETAEIVAKVLKIERKLMIEEELVPHGDIEKLIKLLRKEHSQVENILLVGHQPYLGALVSILIVGRSSASFDFRKGSLAKVSIDKLEYGHCGILEWFLTPRQICGF